MYRSLLSVIWTTLSLMSLAVTGEAGDGLYVRCLSSDNQPLILGIQNNAEVPDSHVAVQGPKGWSVIQLPSRRFVPYQRACWIGESIVAIRIDGHAFLISQPTTDPRATHLGDLTPGPIAGLQLRNEKRWLLMGAKELVEGGIDNTFGTTKEFVRKSIKTDLALQVNSYPKTMTYVEQLDTLFVDVMMARSLLWRTLGNWPNESHRKDTPLRWCCWHGDDKRLFSDSYLGR